MKRDEFMDLVGADYVDEYDKAQLSQEDATSSTSSTADTISRQFEEIVVRYPPVDLCNYPEYKGKPYFSIRYKENNEDHIGYGTYNPEVLSRYLRDYFMPPAQPEERTETHAETRACDSIGRQAAEPTLEQVELYCKRRCLTVISDEMLAKLIEERDSILAGAIPVAWINAKIESMKGTDNKLAELTADVTATALNEWRKELEGKTT